MRVLLAAGTLPCMPLVSNTSRKRGKINCFISVAYDFWVELMYITESTAVKAGAKIDENY